MSKEHEKLISIEKLSVEYRTDDAVIYAVNNLDLDIYMGETLGLVGETGAGKTTIALSILNLLPDKVGVITSGKIMMGEKELNTLPNHEMRKIRGEKISMIFQDPMTSLNPALTVGDQIAEVLKLHPRPGDDLGKVDMRVREILEMVGIPGERATEYPHQFSGGMKQRVVIAMALACQPELILADEPTTALDVTIQAQVLELMQNLKKKLDTSMLLITHDLGVVARTCDRVAIIYAGEIVESGTVWEVFEGDVHHPYTEGLFKAIPNLTQSVKRLTPIEGLMPDPTQKATGCSFAPRCGKCHRKCFTEPPKVHKQGSHMVRCHLLDDDEEE